MAVEKVYKCDLCGEFADLRQSSVLRAGKRDWRPEDCVVIDIGPCCAGKPVSDVLAVAAERDAGFVR